MAKQIIQQVGIDGSVTGVPKSTGTTNRSTTSTKQATTGNSGATAQQTTQKTQNSTTSNTPAVTNTVYTGGTPTVDKALGSASGTPTPDKMLDRPEASTTSPTPATSSAASTYVSKGTYNDAALSDADKAVMALYQQGWQSAHATGDREMMDYYHQMGEDLRAKYGYSGGVDGSEYIPIKKETTPTVSYVAPTSNRAPDLTGVLDAWKEAATEANEVKVDYAVEKGTADLERAYEDAQSLFQTQQNAITADELAAKDNSALYAEMRGDKGGIGNEQYDSISNTAALNRQTVQSEQTKLATDTWRQIADLRAQGEFEKADAVLEITQTYLSQLMSLEQWAAEYNLSVAQFEESIRQWEAEFEAQISSITGQYKGAPTLAATTSKNNTLASAGEALLNVGIMPSEEQLAAMGITAEQAQSFLMVLEAEKGSGGGSGGSGGGGIGGDTSNPTTVGTDAWYQQMYDTYGYDAYAKIYYGMPKTYGLNTAAQLEALAEGFKTWYGRKVSAEQEDNRVNAREEIADVLADAIPEGTKLSESEFMALQEKIVATGIANGLTALDRVALQDWVANQLQSGVLNSVTGGSFPGANR